MKEFLKKAWRYISIDGVSTIFFVIITTGTVVSFNKDGYTLAGALLAMCDLFILRGIIWQGMYYDLIQELRAKLEGQQK